MYTAGKLLLSVGSCMLHVVRRFFKLSDEFTPLHSTFTRWYIRRRTKDALLPTATSRVCDTLDHVIFTYLLEVDSSSTTDPQSLPLRTVAADVFTRESQLFSGKETTSTSRVMCFLEEGCRNEQSSTLTSRRISCH